MADIAQMTSEQVKKLATQQEDMLKKQENILQNQENQLQRQNEELARLKEEMNKINQSRIDEDYNDYKDKQEHGYKPNEELNQQDKKIHYLLEAINGLVKLQDRQRENFIQKPKEKSMNPNLPLFHGRINEDVSEWFFTLEQNRL